MWWRPDWAAPSGVGSAMTTRAGGCSDAPYASANLGLHVGDVADRVRANRNRLQESLGLDALAWFDQVHGCEVAQVAGSFPPAGDEVWAVADAAVTRTPGVGLAIMVADCLPVLFASRDGRCVAVAHAGWRGLAAGVLEACVKAMDVPADQVVGWLGPAIGGRCYEVDEVVRRAFSIADAPGFAASRPGHYWLDLVTVATARLRRAGLSDLSAAGECTFTLATKYFSHRREAPTGRCAAVVWIRSDSEPNR